jgi:hypothetical protein
VPASTLPLDDIPASATPTIICESAAHVILPIEFSKILLIGHLSFKPVLGGLEISLT